MLRNQQLKSDVEGIMKNSNTHQYEQNHFAREVMNTIVSISELDHSPNYHLSKDYYERNKTFDGIKDFLIAHNELKKNYEE